MNKSTKVEIDTKTFIRFWLVILGFGLAGYLLILAGPGLLIIGIALLIAMAISPLVKKLASIFPGKSRNFSIALAYVLVVGFIAAFVATVFPTVISETINFAKNLPTIIQKEDFRFIQDFGKSLGIENFNDQIMEALGGVSASLVNNLGGMLTASIGTIASFGTATILVLILALFMLTEGPDISKTFWKNFKHIPRAKRVQHILHRMNDVFTRYVSGAITVALINAVCTFFGVLVISLCFGLDPGLSFPFALITGTLCLIPMFGSFLGGCLVALLLFFNSLGAGIAFLIYTIVYLQFESNLISPKVQGKGMGLPPLIILASVTLGVYTFGLIGAIIAIPIAGCVKVLLEEFGDEAEDILDDGILNGSNKKPEPKPDKLPPKSDKIIADK